MSMTFTKLFSSITESTIWGEPDHIRIAWITMLAMADSRGRVWASIPGLANRARISVEQAEEAIWRFQQPDRYSRTPDNEGRRIEPIDGGWRLLNHEKYRQIRDEEAIKESKRRYINTRRAKERDDDVEGVEKCRTPSNSVDEGRDNADADADADADSGKQTKKGSAPRSEKEAVEYGSMIGVPEADCIAFFNHFESMGWVDKNGNAIRSWQHKLKTWKATAEAEAHKHKQAGIGKPRFLSHEERQRRMRQIEAELDYAKGDERKKLKEELATLKGAN